MRSLLAGKAGQVQVSNHGHLFDAAEAGILDSNGGKYVEVGASLTQITIWDENITQLIRKQFS